MTESFGTEIYMNAKKTRRLIRQVMECMGGQIILRSRKMEIWRIAPEVYYKQEQTPAWDEAYYLNNSGTFELRWQDGSWFARAHATKDGLLIMSLRNIDGVISELPAIRMDGPVRFDAFRTMAMKVHPDSVIGRYTSF